MNTLAKNVDPAPAWTADWQVAMRVWIERLGQTVVHDGLAELLAAIRQTNSISAAARTIGISYRHAWKLIQDGNAAAGEHLVSAAVGGTHGGGTQLTPLGILCLRIFGELNGEVRSSAAGVLRRILAPSLDMAATVHLSAAISLQEVVGQVLTEFALRRPTVRVRAMFGSSNELADQLLSGAPCDLFLSADAGQLNRLDAAGLIRGKSRRTLALNRLALVVPSQRTRGIATPESLLAAGVKHVVLADPACPLGAYSRAFLQHLGIYDALLPKVVHVDNSRGVVSAMRAQHVDAGLAFMSDAAHAADCEVVFSVHQKTVEVAYEAAVVQSGERATDAQALLEYFVTPIARRCFREWGFVLPKVVRPAKKPSAVK